MTYPAEHLETIDSTNTEAMRRIVGGMHGPLWIVAREQTAGRGRSGRAWVSKPGNFYGSLILPLDVPRERAAQLSLIVGIAVFDALTTAAGGPIEGLRLKWPNDVLVGRGKLAGILVESTTTSDGRLLAVVGIGINLAAPPTDIGRAVAALTLIAQKSEPALLVAPLSHSLEQNLRLWSAGTGFEAIRRAWVARAGALGEPITFNTGAGIAAGAYVGLDDDGALLMRRADGRTDRITFGDVMIGGE
jgi:BirA family transcriptional regulator, biotin operon repressor / biotin---[acetyl-CoA-carboxylase] ligase